MSYSSNNVNAFLLMMSQVRAGQVLSGDTSCYTCDA